MLVREVKRFGLERVIWGILLVHFVFLIDELFFGSSWQIGGSGEGDSSLFSLFSRRMDCSYRRRAVYRKRTVFGIFRIRNQCGVLSYNNALY